MLTKRIDAVDVGAMVPDEGWWAAVLADEEGLNSTPKEEPNRITGHNQNTVVDWDRIQNLFDQDEVIELRVQGYNRGGILVEGEGIQGFVPVSHLVDMPNGLSDIEKQTILIEYIGKILRLKVIECEPDQERVVFSERAALAGQGRRKYLFSSLKPGEIVTGTVTNVTDFGVFVDLGGLEGLIHVSEISWGRVQHPGDVLRIGQEIQALVLQVSEENARVALSQKRLMANPWETIVNSHNCGDVVPAIITGIVKYGAFARLDEGVEGLIHISSMNLRDSRTDFSKMLYPDQHVMVRILHIDAEKRRLGLSLVSCE
jgi:small subunit ribosomal protein S1